MAAAVSVKDAFSRRCERFSDERIESSPFGQGFFLDTNEERLDVVARELLQGSAPCQSAHVGFSGLYNFDVMGLRGSSRGVICDINPDNARVINFVLSLLCQDVPRDQIADRVTYWCINQKILSEMFVETKRETSWLVRDQSFWHIKRLAKEGKIAVITLDLTEPERLRKMKRLFEDNGVSIDTLYLSNICSWLKGKDKQAAALTSIETISEVGTQILDAHCTWMRDLHQRVRPRGSFPLESLCEAPEDSPF